MRDKQKTVNGKKKVTMLRGEKKVTGKKVTTVGRKRVTIRSSNLMATNITHGLNVLPLGTGGTFCTVVGEF